MASRLTVWLDADDENQAVIWDESSWRAADLLERALADVGSLSAQYLLWVVPLGTMRPDRFAAVHGVVSTLALVGLYSFLAPGILYSSPSPALLSRPQWGALWVVGTGAVLLASAGWLADVVARGVARSKAGTEPPAR